MGGRESLGIVVGTARRGKGEKADIAHPRRPGKDGGVEDGDGGEKDEAQVQAQPQPTGSMHGNVSPYCVENEDPEADM